MAAQHPLHKKRTPRVDTSRHTVTRSHSVCVSVCQSFSLCVCVSVCQSVSLSVCRSAGLPVCVSVCLSFCLSASLSVCPSVRPSVRLSVRLSVCPSVSQLVCVRTGFTPVWRVAQYAHQLARPARLHLQWRALACRNIRTSLGRHSRGKRSQARVSLSCHKHNKLIQVCKRMKKTRRHGELCTAFPHVVQTDDINALSCWSDVEYLWVTKEM